MAEPPDLRVVDVASEESLDPRSGAGCGLAAYAILLIGVCVLGLAGMGMATVNLIIAGFHENPRAMQAGTEVPAWRLQPLRDAGVLGPAEVPLSFHDESADLRGVPACAMLADRLIRVNEDGTGRSLPWGQVVGIDQVVGGAGDEVVIVQAAGGDDETIGCRFGPDEGAHKFLRQVQVEQLRAERGG